jgi:hypothetical protein
MDELDELRKKYEDLKNECKKCSDPIKCPTCGIMRELVRIFTRLDAKSRMGT